VQARMCRRACASRDATPLAHNGIIRDADHGTINEGIFEGLLAMQWERGTHGRG
jgi:hypothetical protein